MHLVPLVAPIQDEIAKEIHRFKFFVETFPWMHILTMYHQSITSKINGTLKSDNFPISKLHCILAVSNILAHNNL